MSLNNHWYEYEKTGWYEFRVERHEYTVQDWTWKYNEIVRWIFANIDAPYKHARWIVNPEHAQFRFRYERNYLQFLLRWS